MTKPLNISFLISLFMLSIGSAAAEVISISLSVENCHLSIMPVGGDRCDRNQCDGIKGCVCANVDDQIEWSFPSHSNKEFKFKFKGASPLKNCGDKFTKQKKKCELKRTLSRGKHFDYDVKIKSCPEVFDPRIIIK